MKITIMQAVIIFWSSLMVWVFVEYLFYRIQHSAINRNNFDKQFKQYKNGPIH